MTKEDYMQLSKERLAELLAERDSAENVLRNIPLQTWQNPCADPNYPCTNPQMDCINCPRKGSGTYSITISNIK